ncbi:MAG: Rod shape-determining protein MreD [Cyclobacteriaceae bacterium]
MNSRNYILQAIILILYLLAQIVLFNELILFRSAFAFVYVAFILLLPLEASRVAVLFLAFITGFLLDIFSDTLGIHSAACVLIAFLRPNWLNVITPRGGYDSVSVPALKVLGFQWFITYIFPIIFVHHFALFYIEAGGFHMFFTVLGKVLISTFFNTFLIILVQYLFYRNIRAI